MEGSLLEFAHLPPIVVLVYGHGSSAFDYADCTSNSAAS
jgi:hypothetical protein